MFIFVEYRKEEALADNPEDGPTKRLMIYCHIMEGHQQIQPTELPTPMHEDQAKRAPVVDELIPIHNESERAEHLQHLAKFMTKYSAAMH